MIDGEGKRLKAGAELPDDLILIVIVICVHMRIYICFMYLYCKFQIVIFYVSINSIHVHTFVIE